jgi:hypothetical protein
MEVISGTFRVILCKSITVTVKVVQYHNIIYQAIFDDLVCLFVIQFNDTVCFS